MEWFENETLWRELYPYVFPVERVAAAHGQVTRILALADVSAGAVLDLCCGPGRHAVEFARRGFTVTGVDRSPYLLERARESADAAGTRVEWVLDDMREFQRPAAFDLACNLFTSFGYFAREEDNLRVLRNVRQSLRDGGTFVMDMVGKEHMQRQGMKARRTQFADGAVLIQQPHVRDDWTRLESEWTVVKNRPVAELPVRAPSLFGTGVAGPSAEAAASTSFASTGICRARPTSPRPCGWWRWHREGAALTGTLAGSMAPNTALSG